VKSEQHEKFTIIKITKEVVTELKRIGMKDEVYDSILRRLILVYDKSGKDVHVKENY